MKVDRILKQLISIPSWVNDKTNEEEIGKWIYGFLKKNSDFNVSKQPIDGKRFNVIAQNGTGAVNLVTGHIDTVKPNSGWKTNPFKPEIKGDRLSGLGSSDMKCGIAIMLYLATLPNLRKNLMFLFYCDEEYDFLGMKKFIAEYKNKIKPKLIISLDGEGLQIGNSCRGLIELRVSVEGKAGHSANPKSGINAITQSFNVIGKIRKYIRKYQSQELGSSTLNIAYIKGGGSEGNIIAEKCEYIVEIRVANNNLNAGIVKQLITRESEKLGLKVDGIKIRHDLGSWITPKEKLNEYIKLAPIKKLKSAKKSGYIDVQMLWKTFGKVPTFSLGAGEKGMSHKANEFVKIPDILKAQKFYQSILTNKLLC